MTAAPQRGSNDLEPILAFFIDLLPVQCAAVSSLGHPFAIETIAVTTMLAATLDETQIDLGQGPAWDAHRTGRPVVLRGDVDADQREWPFFAPALDRAGIRTATSLPMCFEQLTIGAVTLYSAASVRLSTAQIALAEDLTMVLARSLITQMTGRTNHSDPLLSRRSIQNAALTIARKTQLNPGEALLAMRVRAFTSGISVRDVAAGITTGSRPFLPDAEDGLGRATS